jgi:hypothetical protein
MEISAALFHAKSVSSQCFVAVRPRVGSGFFLLLGTMIHVRVVSHRNKTIETKDNQFTLDNTHMFTCIQEHSGGGESNVQHSPFNIHFFLRECCSLFRAARHPIRKHY